MIINIHKRESIERRRILLPLPTPNRDALLIQASQIELVGDQLKAIKISVDDGYNYSTMKTDKIYRERILVKTNLEYVRGYSLRMTGNVKISGCLSTFGSTYGLFTAPGVDPRDLLCDVTDISGLFINTDINWQPILQDRPYIFSETFKHCVSLPVLDLSMISNENLYNSKFYEFLPATSQIRFSIDCPKELQQTILDARYEDK